MIIKPCTSSPGLLAYLGKKIDLAKIKHKLSKYDNVKIIKYDEFILIILVDNQRISIFPDGRIILHNLEDEETARNIVKWLENIIG